MRSIDERVAEAPAENRAALRMALESAERGRKIIQGQSALEGDSRTVRAMATTDQASGLEALPTAVGKVPITGRRGNIVVLADSPQADDTRKGLRVRTMGTAKRQHPAPAATRDDMSFVDSDGIRRVRESGDGPNGTRLVSQRAAKIGKPGEDRKGKTRSGKTGYVPASKPWHVEVLDAATMANVNEWQDHYLATRQVLAFAEARNNARLRSHCLTVMRLLRAKFGPVPTPANVRPVRQDRSTEFRTISGQRRVIFD